MSISFKPAGYSTVSPYLIVDGATKTIEFLCQAFGATVLRQIFTETGKVKHSEVQIDDTVLMIADRQADWPVISAHVHIYVENVDDAYACALDLGLGLGAVSVQSPMQQDDPDRRAGIRDAGGTTWWIATRVE
ncbi:MAG: VOC family protein [Cyanobacteria bacterium J06573_11]